MPKVLRAYPRNLLGQPGAIDQPSRLRIRAHQSCRKQHLRYACTRSAHRPRSAIASPLLEVTIEAARGVLFNIIGGPDLSMSEVDEAAKIIASAADPDANIIFGATIDDSMRDQIKITVIATGFDEAKQRLKELSEPIRETPLEQVRREEEKPLDDEDDVFEIPAFLRQRN